MPIGYVPANSPVRKGDLNEAASELDTILRIVFQEKSFLAYRYDDRGDVNPDFQDRDLFGEPFFFGDSGSWDLILDVFGSASPYDHDTYVAAATALTVDTYDEEKHLAICSEAVWPLTGSLGVHVNVKDGVDYYLAQEGDDPTRPIVERERFRRLPVAEIICEAITELEWDSRFTRYHFLRFHNLSLVPMTVTLGETEIEIPALGCKAVRRSYPAGDTWDTSLTYLWLWQSGDSALWSADLANNVGGLQCMHDWLDWLMQSNATYGYVVRDPSVIWSPTTGSPFPNIETSKRVFEFDKHLGRILAWKVFGGVATEYYDITPTMDELVIGSTPIRITTDSIAHTVVISNTTAGETIDAMGPESTLLPRYPKTLPHTIASGQMAAVSWYGAYDPTGVNPGYSAQYRTSRADPTTWITVSTGELPEHVISDFATRTFPEMTIGQALAGYINADTPTFGDETTPDPVLSITSDGFRLWLTGTHDFPATTRESPIQRTGDAPVKFWWTIDSQSIHQSFGVDLTARSGWLHSTSSYGRHTIDQDGYIDGLGDAIQEGNPDVSGTYGIDGGRDWTESRTTHEDPTVKRCEGTNENREETLTLSVRPKTDTSERVVDNASDLDWYNLNRTDLLANTLDDEDKAGVVMYPILWSHFNHLAMRLNSIKAVSPFLIQHVAYWGDLSDGTWPAAFSTNVPVSHFASVLGSGSRADELGLTVQSITESGDTGYYVTIADVAAKASELGLAMATEGLFSYRTRLVPPDATEQTFWQWTHSNTATAYRNAYLPSGDEQWAVSRRTISFEGYSIYSPGINRKPQENTVDLNRSVDFPVVPEGWLSEVGSRILCAGVEAIGYVSDPLGEPRVLDEPPAGAIATEYEELDVYPAPTGDPRYLEIENEIDFPITHSTITSAMNSSGDDRSEWHVTYVPRILIVRSA